MKIKILQVSATNKKKDGDVMPNNTLKVGLKTTNKQGEEVWLNGIVEKDAMTFAQGQEVELDIKEGNYGWEFKAPTMATIINAIDNRLRKVEMFISGMSKPLSDENALEERNEPDMADIANDVKPEDIPF